MVLTAPQWAYLSKMDVFHKPEVNVTKHPDGTVSVELNEAHYSLFLQSITSHKPRTIIADITVEIDECKYSVENADGFYLCLGVL